MWQWHGDMWLVWGQNGASVDHPLIPLGCPLCFGSYFFSCRPSPKPSLLDGWKTSMDGSAGREEDKQSVLLLCPC